jgi:hypothetical protein
MEVAKISSPYPDNFLPFEQPAQTANTRRRWLTRTSNSTPVHRSPRLVSTRPALPHFRTDSPVSFSRNPAYGGWGGMNEQERIDFAPNFGEAIKVIIFEALEVRPLTTVILQEGYRHIDTAWFYREAAGKRDGAGLTCMVPQGPRNSSAKRSKRQVFLVKNSSSPLSFRTLRRGKCFTQWTNSCFPQGPSLWSS